MWTTDEIPSLRTCICGRMRKGYSDTMARSDFNRCLEGTRRTGRMDEAIKMPGRWRGSNKQKAGKGYLYITGYSPSKTDNCHKCFIQKCPQNFYQHSKADSSRRTSKWQPRRNKIRRNRRKKKEKERGFIGVQALLPPAAPGQLISKPYCICKWLSQPNTRSAIL